MPDPTPPEPHLGTSEPFTDNLFFLLEETFESPAREGGNAYLDRRTGWWPTLEALDAERASRPVAPGATSVAGQLEHTRFYLEVLLAALRDELHGGVDWKESWSVKEVSPEAWDDLRARFRDVHGRVLNELRGVERWDDDRVGGAMAIVVHSAYHLGAVRQMLRVLASGPDAP